MQEWRPATRIFQGRTVPILKPVNLEGNDKNVVLVATTDARPSAKMNVTLLAPPPSCTEDVPLPPPLLLVRPLSEMNEILTNLVNLLQQNNNKLESMEKNQEKILTKVSTQIE